MTEAQDSADDDIRNINIDINLNAPQHELQRSIQKCIYLVAGGLLSASQIEEPKLKLPDTSIEMTFDPSLVWSAPDVRSHLQEWILLNGFRDAVESLGSFLELNHAICSAWGLIQLQAQGRTLTRADWERTMVGEAQKFHRLGLPDKLNHLNEVHGIELDPALSRHMLSINAARNCLVHRDGVVSERDSVDGRLVVTWRRVKLVITDEDGERDLVFDLVHKKESSLGMKFLDEQRSFNLGDRITFSAPEFQHIAWSMYLFGVTTGLNITEWGVANGFITLPPKP